MNSINEIIEKLKIETNYQSSIIYREMKINKTTLFILYNEPLTSSVKISDFVIRSLYKIGKNKNYKKLYENIKNNISNFKVIEIHSYEEICSYLHRGFSIIIVEKSNKFLALETKSDSVRSITIPESENTIRGSKDAFVEEYQTNIGLIKKRIRNNNLWIKEVKVGKYTDTQIGVISINTIVKKELINKIVNKLEEINIDGIVDGEIIKNLIEKENKTVFPTIQTTERPDVVCNSLLEGKAVLIIDNCPYALVIPNDLNDFFKTSEDYYAKGKNATITRIIKYTAFFIALFTPAIYISLITYNLEVIPTKLLVEFAVQREGVPFPAFFEAIVMILSFEILKEADYRVPSFTGSALSIVGALILGEAAVNAGIVSPIMIIVIAITSISSLAFNEPDITNAIRHYRIIFMIGAILLGIIGIVLSFMYFLIKLCSIDSFGLPYMTPYSPTVLSSLKDSIIKFPEKKLNKRNRILSNNIIKQRRTSNEKN